MGVSVGVWVLNSCRSALGVSRPENCQIIRVIENLFESN